MPLDPPNPRDDTVYDVDRFSDWVNALEFAEGVSIDDNGGSITIDTNTGPISIDDNGSSLTIDTDDGPISVDINNEPISIDDNNSSITIDTTSGPIDVTTTILSTTVDSIGGIDHQRVRNYGVQPDGDLVGEQASGEVASFNGTLNVGQSFETDWFDTDGWETVEVFISADEPSQVSGLEVELTKDAQATTPEVLATKQRTFDGEAVDRGYEFFKFGAELDGARVRYTNDGTQATDATIVVTLRTSLSLDSADYVGRNILGDNFIRVGTSEDSEGIKIGEPTSLFGDMETIERRTLVDLSSSFGTSKLRDEVTSTGSGSITQDPDPDTGEIELSTGTTANSSIQVDSAEYGRYTPGYSAQQGVGIRIPSLPTEGEIRWGYFDDNNGFYWGYNAGVGELFVASRANGTEKKRVYESNWNGVDPDAIYDRVFNGAEEGAIFQIDFSWYGYGIVNYQVVDQTADTISGRTPLQETTNLHSLVERNGTTTTDPNEPIRIEAENAGTGEDVRVRFGGRQFSVFGQESKEKRTTSQTRSGVTLADGAWSHIMTWRRKTNGVNANARLSVNNFDLGVNGTAKFAVVVNPNVTGLSYQTPELTDPDETLLEVSTAGTFNGLGNGTKAWGGSIRTASQGNVNVEKNPEVNLSLGQNNYVSLIGQGIGGNRNFTGTFRFTEDW